MKRAGLAATIKARWICEQAHQQLKEKLGLDHFEGRSWQGLHRHALMTMIAYAFLQHRHLTQVGRKKESTDRRLSLACRPYATPSSISFFDHYLSNAHTAEDEAVKNSGVGKSAKVVLGQNCIVHRVEPGDPDTAACCPHLTHRTRSLQTSRSGGRRQTFPTLLSADILALPLQRKFVHRMLWNIVVPLPLDWPGAAEL
jgi:hypothetical protein